VENGSPASAKGKGVGPGDDDRARGDIDAGAAGVAPLAQHGKKYATGPCAKIKDPSIGGKTPHALGDQKFCLWSRIKDVGREDKPTPVELSPAADAGHRLASRAARNQALETLPKRRICALGFTENDV
jgi:hypothetical protein